MTAGMCFGVICPWSMEPCLGILTSILISPFITRQFTFLMILLSPDCSGSRYHGLKARAVHHPTIEATCNHILQVAY
ncbi:hypothetical protein BDW59DRAFT_143028, partial [Aspergillus cavernicola]